MNTPFKISNLPKKIQRQTRDEINLINKNIYLKNELYFYKSLFDTHQQSVIFNLSIKKKRGNKVWIDRIREHHIVHQLDKDPEVLEWLEPIKCER